MKTRLKIKLRSKILGIFISVLLLLSTLILATVYTEMSSLAFKDINNQLNSASTMGYSLLSEEYPGLFRYYLNKLKQQFSLNYNIFR